MAEAQDNNLISFYEKIIKSEDANFKKISLINAENASFSGEAYSSVVSRLRTKYFTLGMSLKSQI